MIISQIPPAPPTNEGDKPEDEEDNLVGVDKDDSPTLNEGLVFHIGVEYIDKSTPSNAPSKTATSRVNKLLSASPKKRKSRAKESSDDKVLGARHFKQLRKKE